MEKENNMNLENEFIPYEQALALKELGFDEPCFGYYKAEYEDGINPLPVNLILEQNKASSNVFYKTSAPTFQQVFSWFREKYNIHGIILYYGKSQWSLEILDYKGNQLIQIEDNTFWSHKEAELECLKKLIEIIKQKT